jgi:hypothetical protein
MLSQKGIIKKENKHSLIAERLPQSIILKELDFYHNGDTAIGGYEDMFRGVKKAVNTNDDINHNKDPKKTRRSDKEDVKAAQAFERHIQAIKSQKVKIPPARVKHDKTDTIGKTKDIMIDKLSCIVGGKALLEDT